MGEIAEMMLDGTMCATCGEFIHEGEADGIPRYCCDDCDPHYTTRNQSRKPENDKPFFVIKHSGSIKALPQFLQGITFDSVEEAKDKKGNPMIRLRTGRNTRGIVVIVSHFLFDQTRQAIDNHLSIGSKP